LRRVLNTLIFTTGGSRSTQPFPAAGEVAIDPVTANVDASSIGVQGHIEVNNSAMVDASGEGGGRVVILGGRLVVEGEGTSVKADTLGAQNGRGIDIELTDGLEVRNAGQVTTSTFGTGKGGDITITAPSILMEGDSFEHTPRIASETFSPVMEGMGGAITFHADSLTLNAAAEISTTTFGPANAGAIDINASTLRLIGSDFALTQISANANPLVGDGGAGGDLVIHADSVEIANGAGLTAITYGSGNAGVIDVLARSLTLLGGGIGVTTGLTGNGGAVRIQADTVTMDQMNGFPSFISAVTFGDGQGGSITLDLAGSLRLLNGSSISANTQGANAGGSINIHARDINLDASSSVQCAAVFDINGQQSSGQAGAIALNADTSVLLNGGSSIRTSAPLNNGGNISVAAGSEIRIADSQITTEAGLNGGEILLAAPELTYLLNSKLTAQADTTGSGFGNGGNLTIDPSFLILNNSALISKSSFGNGGNIGIQTDYFFKSASTIDASAPFGLPGTVSVSAPEVDLSGSLIGLPSNLLGAETQLRSDCGVRLTENISSFVVLGRGGLPLEPGGFVPSWLVPPQDERK